MNKPHYEVVCAVIIKDNLVFCCKRKPFGECANKWEFPGGKIEIGETKEEALIREIKEELGLSFDLSNTRCNFTFTFDDGYDDIYLINVDDIDLNSLTLQESEVIDARWASYDEIIAMIRNGEFITYIESYIKVLFDMRTSIDMYSE